MCLLAFPDGCYWFESGGFKNWSVLDNLFIGCAAGGGATPDIFVAACAPTYVDSLPTKNGNAITVGQPFADGKIVGNHFIQHGEPHHAVELYGFSGLKVQGNTVELAASSSLPIESPTYALESVVGLCGDVCGSFDGFDVTEQNGARVWGWAVDVKLTAPNVSSYVSLEMDGVDVWSTLADNPRPDLVGKVSAGPLHGFDTNLPKALAEKLTTGNHTVFHADNPHHNSRGMLTEVNLVATWLQLAVLAHRQDGSKFQLNKGLYCVNEYRSSCSFPADCDCGAPKPARMLISNSIMCDYDSNVCDGQPCSASAPAGGCVTGAE